MSLVVREVDLDREMSTLIDVFSDSFDMALPRNRFEWLYLQNPDGLATAWFVVDDRSGDVAGCTAVFPRRIRLRGGPSVVAWNCGDFCIARKYRTMGAAIRLRRAARDAVDAGAASFLYAHPNDRMLQVHLKVGHRPLGRMIRLARPLRLATGSPALDALSAVALRPTGVDWLFGLGSGVRPIEVDTAPEAFDRLDGAVSQRLGTALVRDSRYLSWRFGKNPVQLHEFLGVWHSGRLVGWVVVAITSAVAIVKDWLAEDPRAWRLLFGGMLAHLRQRHVRSVTVTVLESHPDLRRLRLFGFVPRPGVSTVVTYAPEGSSAYASVTSRSAWYMTLGDRDV